jgi:hypothetical protein
VQAVDGKQRHVQCAVPVGESTQVRDEQGVSGEVGSAPTADPEGYTRYFQLIEQYPELSLFFNLRAW